MPLVKTPPPKELTKTLTKFYQNPIAKVSTELFLTIGAITFFAMFAIKPTIITMTELVKEIEDKRKTSQLLSNKIAALSTVQTEYFSLGKQLSVIDEVLPPNIDVVRLLTIAEKIASDNNLVITSAQVDTIPPVTTNSDIPTDQKSLLTQKISVSVAGDYQNIKNFIETIGRIKPLTTLESVFFNRPKNTSDTTIRATVDLTTYYLGKKPVENKLKTRKK